MHTANISVRVPSEQSLSLRKVKNLSVRLNVAGKSVVSHLYAKIDLTEGFPNAHPNNRA